MKYGLKHPTKTGWYRRAKPDGNLYPTWFRRYKDEFDKRREFKGTPDIAVSEKRFKDCEQEVAHRKHLRNMGYSDFDNRPIKEIIEEYIVWGLKQGGHGGGPWDAKYSKNIVLQVPRIAESMGVTKLVHITYGKFAETISKLFVEPGTRRTCGGYFKGFVQWCFSMEKMPRNPLAGQRERKMESTRKRRVLTIEEIGLFLEKVPSQYLLAFQIVLCTGIRSKEMNSLKPAYLRENGFILPRGKTKNRKEHFFPVPKELMEPLESHARLRSPHGSMFDLSLNHKGRQVRKYLKEAGIPYETEEGYVDFHALRTAFVTYLGQCAEDPTTLLQLARHAKLDFSVKTYGRTTEERKQVAVEKTYSLIHNVATYENTGSGK